jgi:hypothetical protein
MNTRTTDPRSLQLGAGIVFFIAGVIALFVGSLVVALVCFLIAAGFFWATTRARTSPTA